MADLKGLVELMTEELKRANPESNLSPQERLDLAFKRALEMTTPERAGQSFAHPENPRNPYNWFIRQSDDTEGWI